MMSGFSIIFWVAITTCLMWVVFHDRPDARQQISNVFPVPRARRDPAEEILSGRLANGEIDAEGYERALRVLNG